MEFLYLTVTKAISYEKDHIALKCKIEGTQGQLAQKVLNEQGAKMPTIFLIKEIAESEKENMEKFTICLFPPLKHPTGNTFSERTGNDVSRRPR